MSNLDEGEALHFLLMSPEKGDSLFQALWVVRYSHPGIATMAHPSAKRLGLVTVVEMELRKFTATLAEVILPPRRTVFFTRGEAGSRP